MHNPTKSPRPKVQQFRYQTAHFCDRSLAVRYRDIGHRASGAFGFSFNFHVLNNHPPPPVGGSLWTAADSEETLPYSSTNFRSPNFQFLETSQMTKHDRDLTRSSQSSPAATGNPSDDFEGYNTDLLEASVQAHELAVRAQKSVSATSLYESGTGQNTNSVPSLSQESTRHVIRFAHTFYMMSTAPFRARTAGRATGPRSFASRHEMSSNWRPRCGVKS